MSFDIAEKNKKMVEAGEVLYYVSPRIMSIMVTQIAKLLQEITHMNIWWNYSHTSKSKILADS